MTFTLTAETLLRVSRPLSVLAAGTVLALAIGSAAVATPITITNHSFEDDVLALAPGPVTGYLNTNIVPAGWTGFDDGNGGTGGNRGLASSAAGSFLNGGGLTATPDADAQDQMFFTAARDIFQVLTTTLQANTTYTLTVDIGDRGPGTTGGFAPGTPVAILGHGATTGANNLIVMNQGNQPAQVDGDWVTWTGQFTTSAAPAGLGDDLRIELTTGSGVGWFDNVRLDAVTVPEPNALLIIISGLSAVVIGARRRPVC